MSEHEHDEECEVPQQQGAYILRWKWSNWDLAGVATTTVAGLFFSVSQGFSVVGQGLNLLAREFSAQANYERHQFDLYCEAEAEREQVQAYRAHQIEMAQALHDIVDGPEEEEGPADG